jgi:uncharacterized protein (DUF433 family)
MHAKELGERIESKPDVMLGKPVFRGTRIPVYVVLDLLDAGATPEEIVDDYEILTLEDVEAAIAFRNQQARNVNVRAL